MVITLPLEPQEEARLAAARSKGLSAEGFVREALDRFLAETGPNSDTAPSNATTGAALIAAMQASPYQETGLEAARHRLPMSDVEF
jgi:hypothetical protein